MFVVPMASIFFRIGFSGRAAQLSFSNMAAAELELYSHTYPMVVSPPVRHLNTQLAPLEMPRITVLVAALAPAAAATFALPTMASVDPETAKSRDDPQATFLEES